MLISVSRLPDVVKRRDRCRLPVRRRICAALGGGGRWLRLVCRFGLSLLGRKRVFVSRQKRGGACDIGDLIHLSAQLFGTGLISKKQVQKSPEDGKNQDGKNPCQLVCALVPFCDDVQGDKEADDVEQPFDDDRNPALAHQKENQEGKLQKQKKDDKKTLAYKRTKPFGSFFQIVLRSCPNMAVEA